MSSPENTIEQPQTLAQGQGRLALLVLAMVGIFLIEGALPRELVLLPFYWIPVVLAAGFANPLQVGALSIEALALGIVSSRQRHLFPTVESISTLLGLMAIALMALLAARERQRRERQIRSIEARSSQIADSVPGVLYEYLQEVYGSGRFLAIGAGCRELLELEPEQLLEDVQAFWRLVHDEDLQRLRDLHRDSAATGASFQHDFRITTPSGRNKWLNLNARPLGLSHDIPRVWCGLMFDITARKLAETNLRRSHAELALTQGELRQERKRLRATLDSLIDPHVVFQAIQDGSGTIVDFSYLEANSAACHHNHRSREELLAMRLSDVVPGQLRTGLFDLYCNVLIHQQPLHLDGFVYNDEQQANERRFFDIRAVPMGPDTFSYTWRDVSERETANQRIAASEQQYRMLAENSFDVVMRLEGNRITWVSPSLTAMLGWLPDEWVGRVGTDFIDPITHGQYAENLKRLEAGESVVARDRVLARNGSWHWVGSHSRPYLDSNGHANGIVVSFRTVDNEVDAEQRLERRARTDELTGLLNRREVLHRIEAIRFQVRRAGDESAVLFCDLDCFKHINDSHGHAAGDTVLITVAQRLRRCLRSQDLAARIGGDELLVLLHGVRDLDNALLIGEKIRRAVAEPIPTASGPLTITLSIGVTLIRTGETADSLVARADQAMYMAKQNGRNRVHTPMPE